MGRVRAVLRLGERADARPPRRAVLAARRRRRRRAGARARLRHRSRLAAARASGRRSRRHRSLGADARARARSESPSRRTAKSRESAPSRPRRHSRAAVRDGTFPMVLAPYGILQSLIRPRDLTATLESVARVLAPRRHVRHRSRARRAELARIREPRPAARPAPAAPSSRLIESVRQDPKRRLTTFEQRYVERRGAHDTGASLRPDVPHAVGAADDAPARTRRVRASRRCSATIAAARGTSARTCGSSWRKRGKISPSAQVFFWEF